MLVIVSQAPHHPVEFSNVLWGIMLDRVNSNTDLEVVMDSRMSFSRYIDVTDGRTLTMLGFVKRLSGEIRDPYILRTLYVLLVRLTLVYASCVWRPFYDMHINMIERVQRYMLLGLEWTEMYDLSSYVDRCAFIWL
jgi:hypothetical protein